MLLHVSPAYVKFQVVGDVSPASLMHMASSLLQQMKDKKQNEEKETDATCPGIAVPGPRPARQRRMNAFKTKLLFQGKNKGKIAVFIKTISTSRRPVCLFFFKHRYNDAMNNSFHFSSRCGDHGESWG